jgi:NAD(P)-dependent dehydrogenase (short-subunit alcohol dehydrogenase family)
MSGSQARPRTAVVTGGTSGIGLAIAGDLLGRGIDVLICGRDATRLAGALQHLSAIADGRAGGGRVDGVSCDVRHRDRVDAMVAYAGERWGGVDILVNNAGNGFIQDFAEISARDWQETLDTHLTGAFHCSQAVLPWMTRAGDGHIVNIGSRAGRNAFRGGAAYNAAKFGLLGLSEALFLDLNPLGIRVTCVMPGTVATTFAGMTPQDWHIQPADVAQAVGDLLAFPSRTCVNIVELRPARYPKT